MANYKLLTDSGCDLTAAMLQELDISVVPLYVNFRGQTLEDRVDDSVKDMFQGFRNGESATTSAVNPEGWRAAMESTLLEGKDALVLTFSSGLSTTYQSAVIAAEELREQYPDRKIYVVDTLCA